MERIINVLRAAKESGREALIETEGLKVFEAMGINTPSRAFVRNSQEARRADTRSLGEKVVVKVVSPRILHKSDLGGVAVVVNAREAIASAIERMENNLPDADIVGFTINEFIQYDAALGNELLLGFRWTEDFGPVVTLGAGGIHAEFLAENFKTGRDIAILSPLMPDAEIKDAISKVAIVRLITEPMRGQVALISAEQIVDAIKKFLKLASAFSPEFISECEINPLVISSGKLVALDALFKLAKIRKTSRAARPIAKLKNLLEPKSAAIIGVSEKLNPGHVIVNNLIREGFDRKRIYIIKPGAETLEGCRCYASISSLPERVDMFVLSITAQQTPEAVAEIIEHRKAESIIIIPGGLEEKSGSGALARRMRESLARSRASEWGGPLINGGNCLGIRSNPGRYDTLFIPEYKLPISKGETAPVAIISQSGAFAISKMNKLASINPKYLITVGNQMDLTIGDYLKYLKDDSEIKVFAIYVEGFAPLDGISFLEAAKEITRSGRTVILYRAGRTPEGARATSSHTASIAGNYEVTRQLSKTAGVVVAESIADFEDLTRLFALLINKRVEGLRLAAVSNAGFECVAIADNIGRFELPRFSQPAINRLASVFKQCRIDSIVDAHNPLDLTPMAADAAYEEAIRAVMEDPFVDIGVIGCVPLTAALNTLPPDEKHHEDFSRTDSIVQRMRRLNDEIDKAWIAVVDAGEIYDPMARALEENGIPTFRTADRALRLFNIFCEEMFGRNAGLAERHESANQGSLV